MQEDKVKWPSKRVFTCKRNKGEHEWEKPVIIVKPNVRYIYKLAKGGTLNSGEPQKEGKLINTEIHLMTKTKCKHCGKKEINVFIEKI
jgi:hypothetical protein